ncbi:hypothetical protein PROAA_340032 [Candidatus Propionivibrio aalborgensis]|uniref:Uncharacterized protein n=1 Tax=Candidatus Propionivibrio aalborgensis TaxID=1860101 RepID=A0A1A8XYD9_9RHOO|nr:hypothetical protein PROAA_340032 [Candidatus Propionivibrio aalborgensis]
MAHSPASTYRPAGRAEITPVLADHRVVAAFAAQLSGGGLGGGAASRGFEYAHLLQWYAFFIEDAEHRVAVDHKLREVGDG